MVTMLDDEPVIVKPARLTTTPREPPRSRAPAIPQQDIETVLGIAERLYHLPGGKNGNGVVGQCCQRLRAWLEKI